VVSRDDNRNAQAVVLPVVVEEAVVGVRASVAENVSVRLSTGEVEKVLEASLASEDVEVERVACDRVIAAVPEIRTEGDVTIIPVFGERAVVHRQLILVEEVRVTRKRRSSTVELPVTLRHQHAEVTRQASPPDLPAPAERKTND
jgi:stress response protein YsnF